MATAFAASIIDFVLGLELGSTAQDSSNRFSLEGLTFGTQHAIALHSRAICASAMGGSRPPGMQADVVGHAEGRNVVRLQSVAVGRGLTAELASLSIRHAVLNSRNMQLECAEITGAVTGRIFVERGQLRFLFNLESTKISGLRFDLHPPEGRWLLSPAAPLR